MSIRRNFTDEPSRICNYRAQFDFIECFTTTFLLAHSWLNWVDEDDDEDEVGLKEKPEDTRYINKRPPGLIAPLLRFWHLLGNPPKNTTKGRDLIFNEGIRLLNMADTSLEKFT